MMMTAGTDDLNSSTTQEAWAQIQFHWEEAYAFKIVDGHPEPFTAQRRDDKEILMAATVDDLLSKLRADYIARPVPRDPKAEECHS